MPTIVDRYVAMHGRSARLAEEGRSIFPDGVTHDIRRMSPFPIYVDHAQSARKWDVDGNEIVDYVMGHGALLLGHAHPSIVAAVEQQLLKGTHYGASHEIELRWGRLVKSLVPCAELVRFTSSGTEAAMMALRLARAATGRNLILKFDDHFHGWQDYVIAEHSDAGLASFGVPPETLSTVLMIPQGDLGLVERTLDAHPGEVAAVILEPTGAHWGGEPLPPGFIEGLRQITAARDIVLIFDEVITGFRAGSGGAQARFNVTPDMTTLAKILAGGLPGGAVVGRSDLMRMIESTDVVDRSAQRRVAHPGTFNSNPLCAAAGAAGLEIVATGEPNRTADRMALRLVEGVNAALVSAAVPGRAYGLASMVHFIVGRECPGGSGYEWPDPSVKPPRMSAEATLSLKRSLMNEGVDLMGTGAMVSAVHSQRDIDDTIAAFERAIAAMRADGVV